MIVYRLSMYINMLYGSRSTAQKTRKYVINILKEISRNFTPIYSKTFMFAFRRFTYGTLYYIIIMTFDHRRVGKINK